MFLGTNSILTRTSLLGRFLGCFGLLYMYFGLFFKQLVANGLNFGENISYHDFAIELLYSIIIIEQFSFISKIE